MLLSTSELTKKLRPQLEISIRCWIYSAFISDLGIDFVIGLRKPIVTDRLLIRCNLADVASGACSLRAIRAAIEAGLSVRLSSALHVKLYVFDKFLYVGSANLTGKGLALVGYCNDELSTEGIPSPVDLEIIENLWAQAVPLTLDIIKRMEDCISNLPSHADGLATNWPDEIISERRDLYCSDFPQGNIDDQARWNSVQALRESLAYVWLVTAVEKNGGAASFGYLSSKLHSDVYDDPAPYRTQIKDLLSNLLSLVVKLKPSDIYIDTPRYAQVVFLSENSQ